MEDMTEKNIGKKETIKKTIQQIAGENLVNMEHGNNELGLGLGQYTN
jgi:hypothetical protein